MIYVIGSLRNPNIPDISRALRDAGLDVFDEWYAAGPDADDCWRDYEKGRKWDYTSALVASKAAHHVFSFDRKYLEACSMAALVCPAGKSAHLEFGWILGQGKKGIILIDDSAERWDVMYKFATAIVLTLQELVAHCQVWEGK